MKENEIKKKYKKKINQLIKHNQLYFEKNKPNISDADYDKLKKEIFNDIYSDNNLDRCLERLDL